MLFFFPQLLSTWQSSAKFSRDFSYYEFIDFTPEAPVKTGSRICLSETDFTAELLKIKPRIWNRSVFIKKKEACYKYFWRRILFTACTSASQESNCSMDWAVVRSYKGPLLMRGVLHGVYLAAVAAAFTLTAPTPWTGCGYPNTREQDCLLLRHLLFLDSIAFFVFKSQGL